MYLHLCCSSPTKMNQKNCLPFLALSSLACLVLSCQVVDTLPECHERSKVFLFLPVTQHRLHHLLGEQTLLLLGQADHVADDGRPLQWMDGPVLEVQLVSYAHPCCLVVVHPVVANSKGVDEDKRVRRGKVLVSQSE